MTDHSILRGTVGGTLMSMLAAIQPGDIVKTIVLSSIGALVSFTFSWLLRKIRSSWRSKRYKKPPG